jgi:hypothetical protein
MDIELRALFRVLDVVIMTRIAAAGAIEMPHDILMT